MKTKTTIFAIAALGAAFITLPTRADDWTDPMTGIRWTYTVSGGIASVGGASYSSPAVPTSTTGAIAIPSTINGYPVTSIGWYAFRDCSGLTSVTIPDGVTSIGYAAFSYCSGLTSVTIPDGVTSIGDRAFQGCSGLTNFVVGANNCNYCSVNGLLLSKDAKKLIAGINGDVTIPDGVTSIGYCAFYGCSGLTSVTIPDGVTSIGTSAFENCRGLTSVTIPDGVTSIGIVAFGYCSRLTSVTIPDSVTSIGDRAFEDCWGLTSVIMKGDCPAVGSDAFRIVIGANGCVVRLPKGNATYTVTNGKWQGMTVEYYHVDPEFTIDDDGVLTKVELNGATEIALPEEVTKVGSSAFHGCSELASVTIPDGVDEIPMSAFDGCEKLWAKWFRTLERMSNEGATTANDVVLTVTNVVVHYVTTAAQSEAVTVSEDVGIVNVISEVNAGTTVAISSEWAAQYGAAFTTKFGSDFTKAITKPTGKRDGAGNAMFVWQDFVAGTDPTDEDDVFTASITFDEDGRPQIAYTPELTEAEAAKRRYTTYGKVKLTDKDWMEVPDGEEGSYNFFKVTVEMR